MAKPKPSDIIVKTFASHKVITQPNPLRKVLRRVDENDSDDPVARADLADRDRGPRRGHAGHLGRLRNAATAAWCSSVV